MTKKKDLTRHQDLIRLARAVYEAVVHEEDKERLGILRVIAGELNDLIDRAVDDDPSFQTDLGLELLLFAELKEDGIAEAETDRRDAVAILETLEKRVG